MEVVKRLFETMRNIAWCGQAKSSAGLKEFFSNKIKQAATAANLYEFVDKLMKLMDVDLDRMPALPALITPFDQSILRWVGKNNMVVSLATTDRNQDFAEIISAMDLQSSQEMGQASPAPECDINFKVECRSPLAHGSDAKSGNATLFRRCNVLSTKGYMMELPFYAGNAVRGQIRDLLASHYIETICGGYTLQPWVYHALFSGGTLEEASKATAALSKKLGNNGAVKAEGITELRKMVPPVSVLGTALGNRVIKGRIQICDLKPESYEWGTGSIKISDLFEWSFLTRREDDENHPAGEKSVAMIANTECLKEGTILRGGINCDSSISVDDKNALAMGVMLWQKSGKLGAEARRGLGRVSVEVTGDIGNPAEYQEYLTSKKEEIVKYLVDLGAITCTQ